MKKVFSMAVLVVFTLGFLLGAMVVLQPVLAAGCDASNIIFSEIDYDQPDTDNAEFLELYIPSGTTISDCEVRFINGSTITHYNITSIAGTYPADTYLHLGVGGDIPIGSNCLTYCIQNGAPDGFALVDTSGGGISLVWFYSYEGLITGYDPGDGSSNTSTLFYVEENNYSPNISLINGSDLGIDDMDETTFVTPGAANINDNGNPNAVFLETFASEPRIGVESRLAGGVVLLLTSALFVLRRRKIV